MGILIPWPSKEEKEPAQLSQPEILYNMYRNARIHQGWEEFKWSSLSETQKRVWKLVVQQLTGEA